jgi:hypothetical protein
MKHRDGKYRHWIASLPCCVCGKVTRSECAHIRYGSNSGIAQKPDDFRCVPLCNEHHAEQHRVGEVTFWYDYGGWEKALILSKKLWEFKYEPEQTYYELAVFKNDI